MSRLLNYVGLILLVAFSSAARCCAQTQQRGAETPKTAYLAAYFDKTEGGERQNPESLHLAVSRDGFHFVSLNTGQAVLTSTLGDQKMRDPMILRAPRGTFHLVVTNSWKKLQFTLWDSSDLIHWTNERLVVPADPALEPTWAPELGYDAQSGQHFVFWTTGKGGWDNTHIYSMTTRDFQTWSPPQTYFQKLVEGKNVPVMDASLFEAKGKFHLVYRVNEQIWQVTSSGGALGPFDTDDHQILAVNGEGPFVYQLNGKDQWNLVFDYYGGNQGKWGVATSPDARTWTFVTAPEPPYYQNGAASFPEGVRHGSVLPLTQAEYEALTKAYGAGK